MTHEQFTFWLKGFMEGKQSLSQSEIDLIKEKANQSIPEVKLDIPWAPYNPYIPPTIEPLTAPYNPLDRVIYCALNQN